MTLIIISRVTPAETSPSDWCRRGKRLKKKKKEARHGVSAWSYITGTNSVLLLFFSVITENQLFHFLGVNASACFLMLLKMFPALICKHNRGARRCGFKHAAGVTCGNSITELWQPLGCRYGADKRLYETLRGCLGGGGVEVWGGGWERGNAGNVACCRGRGLAES